MTLEDALKQYPVTVTDDIPELSEIAHSFVNNTRFENHFVVNSPVMPGMRGAYFCLFDQNGLYRTLSGNCRYVRGEEDRNYILCDVHFLIHLANALGNSQDTTDITVTDSTSISEAYRSSRGVPSAQFWEEQFHKLFRANLSYFFPRWVIGHEIGHAVLGHADHPILLGSQDKLEIGRVSRAKEIAADGFVIERMATDETERMHFFSALTHLLNNWIRVKTDKDSVELGSRDYRGPQIEINDDSLTHPPMIIRLLNLMEACLEKFPDTDTTGYYARLSKRMKPVGLASSL
jgi:hypothetical protein